VWDFGLRASVRCGERSTIARPPNPPVKGRGQNLSSGLSGLGPLVSTPPPHGRLAQLVRARASHTYGHPPAPAGSGNQALSTAPPPSATARGGGFVTCNVAERASPSAARCALPRTNQADYLWGSPGCSWRMPPRGFVRQRGVSARHLIERGARAFSCPRSATEKEFHVSTPATHQACPSCGEQAGITRGPIREPDVPPAFQQAQANAGQADRDTVLLPNLRAPLAGGVPAGRRAGLTGDRVRWRLAEASLHRTFAGRIARGPDEHGVVGQMPGSQKSGAPWQRLQRRTNPALSPRRQNLRRHVAVERGAPVNDAPRLPTGGGGGGARRHLSLPLHSRAHYRLRKLFSNTAQVRRSAG
jgi:hypothetical protein